MNLLSLHPSEGFLLEWLLKGALVMAAAFAIAFVFKRRSAALRHAVWSLAFICLLLLPIGSALLPTWEVAVPMPDGPTTTSTSDVQRPHNPQAALATQQTTADPSEKTAILHAETIQPSPVTQSFAWSWSHLFVTVWMLGAIVLLLRLATAVVKLSALRHRADAVEDPVWIEQAECIAEALDVRRPIQLLQHEEISVPMTYGVRRPVIFLPHYAKKWSREQMHATLMHELLHVKRYDHLVQVLALSARALHWFNPLTWLATRRLVVERERACDDGVLAMGVASSSYADHLLGLAREVLSGREAPAAVLAMARPSELHTRIVAILDPAVPRRAFSRLRAMGVTGCAVILVVALAAMQPGGSPAETVEEPVTAPAKQGGVAGPLEAVEEAHRDPADEATSGVVAVERDAAEPEEIAADSAPDTTDVEAQKRAIHAIAELPRATSVPLLTEIAQVHQNAELRKEAIFWLGQVGDASIGELLVTLARNDPDPGLQRQALFALSEMDGEQGIPALVDLARTHPNDEMRAQAVFWIGEEGGAATVAELEDFARNDPNVEVQKKAVFALSEVDDGAGVPALIELARTHPNQDVRGDAIFWLGESGDERAADVLMEIVNQDGAP